MCYTENMRKLVFATVLFLLAFAVPVMVYSLVNSGGDFDIREKAAEEDEKSEDSNTSVPQIISVPMTQAEVGESYSYKVRAIDGDDDTLEYMVDKKPSWMSWNSGVTTLSGTPSSSDIGTYSVEISVSDGKWLRTQKFDVVVEGEVDGTSEEVQGAESQRSGSQGESGSGSSSATSSVASSSLDDSGGVEEDSSDSAEVTANVTGDVLGASDGSLLAGDGATLPETAVLGSLMGIGLGFGVVAVAIFLWLDAKYSLADRLFMSYKYSKGKQISMDVGDGLVVKKRRIRL